MAEQLDLGTLLVHLKSDSSQFISGMNSASSISSKALDFIKGNMLLTEAAVVGSFVAMGAAAVKQWATIEKATTTASQQMGNTSRILLQQMETQARAIAQNSSTSVSDLTSAYSNLASQGLSAAQSIGALSVVNKAAEASGTSLATTIQTLVGAQSAFNLQSTNATQNTKNLTDVANLFIRAGQEGQATFTQLGSALSGKTGVAMRQFGVSLKDSVAIMEALADAGIPVEETGKQMTMFLNSLTLAAQNNTRQFRELGISIYDTNGKILPLKIILSEISGSLHGLTDEQKNYALSILGIDGNTSAFAKTLLNASGAVEDYSSSFSNLDGVMNSSAVQGTATLADTFKEISNQVKEATYQLGEALEPVVTAVIQTIKDCTANSHLLSDAWKFITDNVGPALITIIGLIGDAFRGWQMIYKTIDAAQALFWQTTLSAASAAADAIAGVVDGLVNNILANINKAIAGLNLILPAAHKISQINFTLNLDTSPAKAALDAAADYQKNRYEQDVSDLNNLASKEKFSDTLLKNYDKATKGIIADNTQIKDSVKGAFSEATATRVTQQFSPQQTLQNQVRANFQAVGSKGYGDQFKQLSPLQQVQQQNMQSASGINFNQTDQLLNQKDQEQTAVKKSQDAIDQARLDGTATTNKAIEDMMRQHKDNVQAINLQLADIVVTGAESIANSLTDIAGDLLGKQTGAYKALFAISKAFAIADSIIKIQQAIAGAFATGATIFDKIADAAIIAAQASSIISTIRSVQLTFGGGKATGGPVNTDSYYMVGEKGPELFAPNTNGSIIPNHQLKNSGVTVTVNNYTDTTATVSKSKNSDGDDQYTVMIKRVKNDIASDIHNGTGPVNRAMTSSFGLQRGKG